MKNTMQTSQTTKVMFPEYCPVYPKKTNEIVDENGNIWKKITMTGYQRQCDKFFWPYDPRNVNNNYHQLPPSVESVALTRNKK